MKIFASLYTDEDIANLVATLLRARGLDVLTTIIAQRVSIILNTLTADEVFKRLLYVYNLGFGL